MFLFIVSAQAYNKQYIKNCIEIANPYTAISTAENLLRKTEICLSRVYIAFPEIYRQELTEKITECIDDLKETEKSKSEYHALQKSIGEITSNVGSSIVDSQQSIENLITCSRPLQIITNIDVYEEARFETVTKSFIENMQTADACIQTSTDIISKQVDDVQHQLETYNKDYTRWLEITEQRQENAQKCQQDIRLLAEKIFNHVIHQPN